VLPCSLPGCDFPIPDTGVVEPFKAAIKAVSMPRPRLSDLSGTRLLEPAGLLPASGAEASREFDPAAGRLLDQPSIEPGALEELVDFY
jgi:hypothetical protein